MARLDVADIAALTAYLHGKVIPRTDTFIRVMVDSLPVQLPIRYDLVDECRQVSGISRRTHLVEDHFQAVLLGGQVHHRLDEVFAVRGIQPGGPEYQIPAAGGQYGRLARQLGAAVCSCGGCGGIFAVRDVAAAVKYIVSGDVNKRCVMTQGG